jgi:hypothetical protein
MHIAREYTEKFLHQQQIRDAVGNPGLLTTDWYPSFLDVCFLALPHTLRETNAEPGTKIKVIVTGDGGGEWAAECNDARRLISSASTDVFTTTVTLTGTDAWKLFSKSMRPVDVIERVSIQGDRQLGDKVLSMVSFMA